MSLCDAWNATAHKFGLVEGQDYTVMSNCSSTGGRSVVMRSAAAVPQGIIADMVSRPAVASAALSGDASFSALVRQQMASLIRSALPFPESNAEVVGDDSGRSDGTPFRRADDSGGDGDEVAVTVRFTTPEDPRLVTGNVPGYVYGLERYLLRFEVRNYTEVLLQTTTSTTTSTTSTTTSSTTTTSTTTTTTTSTSTTSTSTSTTTTTTGADDSSTVGDTTSAAAVRRRRAGGNATDTTTSAADGATTTADGGATTIGTAGATNSSSSTTSTTTSTITTTTTTSGVTLPSDPFAASAIVALNEIGIPSIDVTVDGSQVRVHVFE